MSSPQGAQLPVPRKAKLDGFIGMMGYTKITKNDQPTIGLPPPGDNQIKPMSDLNMADARLKSLSLALLRPAESTLV